MIRYIKGAELPDLEIEWSAADGTAIDFAAGWTFTLKIGYLGAAALVTKTAGITGAAVLPNLVVVWAAGELDAVPESQDMFLQVFARHTASGKDRALQTGIRFSRVIT